MRPAAHSSSVVHCHSLFFERLPDLLIFLVRGSVPLQAVANSPPPGLANLKEIVGNQDPKPVNQSILVKYVRTTKHEGSTIIHVCERSMVPSGVLQKWTEAVAKTWTRRISSLMEFIVCGEHFPSCLGRIANLRVPRALEL